MVAGLFHPLNIFILGLAGGFLVPVIYRVSRPGVCFIFFFVLAGMTAVSAVSLTAIMNGAPPIEILTAGAVPPFSINLRFGLLEGVFALCVNVVALLGAWHLWGRLRDQYATMLVYLVLVMGINGMVMTRDLFNLFVFLEIVSIGTYGLLGLGQTPAALAASFKYIMATVLASTFFLLGTTLLYYKAGTLNIDGLVRDQALITGPIGISAILFLLASLLIELKPFPANGWGLDVYETAPSGVAALVSVGASTGILFALYKLLPLFGGQLGIIALSGGLTFLFSNLIGLRQTNVQRLLGYSSIGQMGLMVLALALLRQLGADAAMPLVVGGLFINHLLAKAGLFWLAGLVGKERTENWPALTERRVLLIAFALLLLAIAGLPPFPGFWAKWQFVMQLAAAKQYAWIGVVLVGSLLEAAYLFRWFGQSLRAPSGEPTVEFSLAHQMPVVLVAAMVLVSGYAAADLAGAASFWLFMPLYAGGVLWLLDWLPGQVKCGLMLIVVLAGGLWLVHDLSGLAYLFSVLLLFGSLIVASASLYRPDARPGFYPLMAMMLLSVPALFHATTTLEFFFSWEIVTIASYFLIARTRRATAHALTYLLFSLASAFFLLAGFGLAYAATGTIALASVGTVGAAGATAFLLLEIGFLVKAGALGVHIWLPDAYAEADDDLSAMLSAVISKLSIFGLLTGTYLAIRSQVGLDLAHAMGWVGLLTTTVGAAMAFQQTDLKRMLACSSMSQIGYIVTAIALMSHIGWVTGLYLVANHLMVKGILFLAAAGIILRTGSRLVDGGGGLARRMPFTFAAALIAIVAMSGLPPLMGFGAKWLLLSAIIDKGWYGLAALSLLATFIGFLYMGRLVWAIFLGPRLPIHDAAREAPPALLVPQFILVAAIFVLSFYPKLVIGPVSAAIDPTFASTLVWQGMSLEAIYSYWNPVPFMAFAVGMAALLLAVAWMLYRLVGAREMTEASLGGGAGTAGGLARQKRPVGFRSFYNVALDVPMPPLAVRFWSGLSRAAMSAADLARRVYSGNGQVYGLYVVYYLVVVFLLGGGFGTRWGIGQ